MDQLPSMMDYNIRNGHTYMYFKSEPLYPFGYGLSYTTFSYSNLEVSSNKLKSDGEIAVRVTIENSGNRTGDEVVQLYVKHFYSTIDRPLKEIKGFKRVTLKPNESKTVEIPLKAETLAYWDVDKHSFVVEEDRLQIMVGASSSDTKLQDTIAVVH
jgi:beta-glucosidase